VNLRVWEFADDLAALEQAGMVRVLHCPDGQVRVECCDGC
jgi:hypothetical protein